MPESSLETHELKEQLEEAVEHGEGGHGHGEGKTGWVMYLSLSTAFIAVIAAVAALYAGGLANEAIVLKNDAVLKKSTASDKWGEYNARKIKTHIYSAQLELIPESNKALADKYKGIIDHEVAEGKAPMAEAQRLDKESKERDEESEGLLQRHEIFAKSVTVFQVAIALSAIAALTRKKLMWYCSLFFGLGGVLLFGLGFRPHTTSHESGGETAGEHAAPAESGGAKPEKAEKKE